MNSDSFSPFFGTVKHDVKALSNILGILEKMEFDHHLDWLGLKFAEIFEKEALFAKQG